MKRATHCLACWEAPHYGLSTWCEGATFPSRDRSCQGLLLRHLDPDFPGLFHHQNHKPPNLCSLPMNMRVALHQSRLEARVHLLRNLHRYRPPWAYCHSSIPSSQTDSNLLLSILECILCLLQGGPPNLGERLRSCCCYGVCWQKAASSIDVGCNHF